MEKETEKAVEIPEAEAPPLEAMVEGEADAGNPETRAQIADPDFLENGENSEKNRRKIEVEKEQSGGQKLGGSGQGQTWPPTQKSTDA